MQYNSLVRPAFSQHRNAQNPNECQVKTHSNLHENASAATAATRPTKGFLRARRGGMEESWTNHRRTPGGITSPNHIDEWLYSDAQIDSGTASLLSEHLLFYLFGVLC